jgi:hypothetical protein
MTFGNFSNSKFKYMTHFAGYPEVLDLFSCGLVIQSDLINLII